MIDDNFRPWLIEVNTNPCLETSCPVLEKIVPKMLDDAFKLSIDVVYPPPSEWPASKKHYLGSTGNNAFELVFDEETYETELSAKTNGCKETDPYQGSKMSRTYEMEGIG